MSLRWYKMRSGIAFFFKRRKTFFTRFYWFCLILGVVLIFVIPITLGIRNPDVRLPDFHGPPPPEMIQRWRRITAQANREHGRINDFVTMVNRLYESFPYFELATSQSGIDFTALAVEVFDDLAEVARYEVTPGFFRNFIVDRYLSYLDGLGGLRLSGEPMAMPSWITQPYFYGYYDMRFYDDRFDIPVRDDNISVEVLGDGILYLRVNTFLPKGYELVSRNPFWHFCFETDREHLMELYKNLYDIEDLIIDIRGIGSGFGDYFVPLVLVPFLHEPINMRSYAFHADYWFSNQVSFAYRSWYGLGDVVNKDSLTQGFAYDLPGNVSWGFPIDIAVQPKGDVDFEGRIWLLTDSDNFSGPNFMYLQMARNAGFTIVYEENPDSIGWATSFTHLSHSGISLRFNPLFFTDATGQSFEEIGAVYDYRMNDHFHELLGVTFP